MDVIVNIRVLFSCKYSAFKIVSPSHINVVIVVDLFYAFIAFKYAMIEIRVCMQKSKIKQIAWLIQRQKKHVNWQHNAHITPLGFHPLVALKMAVLYMLSILAKQKQNKKIIVPRWRYLGCLYKNDLVHSVEAPLTVVSFTE